MMDCMAEDEDEDEDEEMKQDVRGFFQRKGTDIHKERTLNKYISVSC